MCMITMEIELLVTLLVLHKTQRTDTKALAETRAVKLLTVTTCVITYEQPRHGWLQHRETQCQDLLLLH